MLVDLPTAVLEQGLCDGDGIVLDEVIERSLELGVAAGQKLTIPIAAEEGPVDNLPSKQVVRVEAGAEVRATPDAASPVIGRFDEDARLLFTARSGEFERLNLGGGRPGWVASKTTSAAKGQVTKNPAVTWDTPNASPEIELVDLDTFVTRDDFIRVKGEATDGQRVRDLYISTSGHKVFYESNQDGKNPRKLAFDAEIPLHPGMNTIMVVAREDNDSVSRHYFMVRRDAEDGSLMETKRFQGALLGNGNGVHFYSLLGAIVHSG